MIFKTETFYLPQCQATFHISGKILRFVYVCLSGGLRGLSLTLVSCVVNSLFNFAQGKMWKCKIMDTLFVPHFTSLHWTEQHKCFSPLSFCVDFWMLYEVLCVYSVNTVVRK